MQSADLRGRAARAPGRVALAQDRRPFGGAQDGLVLGQPGGHAARARAGRVAGDGAFGRRRLAARADHVRLPVIEVQLRGLADLVLGARGVAHVGQRHVDFVFARALDFRLGDAQLVDALAHDVDRPFERFGVDLRLGGRLGLVDELDAALQVEPQARRLGRRSRPSDAATRPATISRTRSVAAAVGHGLLDRDYLSGVSTSNSPPSSS